MDLKGGGAVGGGGVGELAVVVGAGGVEGAVGGDVEGVIRPRDDGGGVGGGGGRGVVNSKSRNPKFQKNHK